MKHLNRVFMWPRMRYLYTADGTLRLKQFRHVYMLNEQDTTFLQINILIPYKGHLYWVIHNKDHFLDHLLLHHFLDRLLLHHFLDRLLLPHFLDRLLLHHFLDHLLLHFFLTIFCDTTSWTIFIFVTLSPVK